MLRAPSRTGRHPRRISPARSRVRSLNGEPRRSSERRRVPCASSWRALPLTVTTQAARTLYVPVRAVFSQCMRLVVVEALGLIRGLAPYRKKLLLRLAGAEIMPILAVHVLAVNGALHALYSVKKCLIHPEWCQKVSWTRSIASKSVLLTRSPCVSRSRPASCRPPRDA